MRHLLAFAALLLLLSGCTEEQHSPAESQPSPQVAQKCVMACEGKYSAGADLSDGPCIGIIADDYVCDVAHSPRAPVDDLAQNQCEEYASGKAHHFVEVTPECRLIREM